MHCPFDAILSLYTYAPNVRPSPHSRLILQSRGAEKGGGARAPALAFQNGLFLGVLGGQGPQNTPNWRSGNFLFCAPATVCTYVDFTLSAKYSTRLKCM